MTETHNNQVSIWKNLGPLVVLFIGGAFVYTLPYFRYYYYDAFVLHFNLNNTQMGMLGSAYGFLAMISYFFGGFLADRVSARKLLAFSMVITGLSGFVLLLFPSFPIVLGIHGLWGITTILTFWPALIKAIRMLAAANEQGKAFGFFESGRGITNAVQMSVVLAIFGVVAAKSGDKMGLTTVIAIYSVATTILGVALYFVLKDNEKEITAKFDINIAIQVIKKPHTWLITLIMFCSYATNMSFYYITPYATSTFATTAVLASALTILAQYCRPIASAGAGLLGDKLGSSKVIFGGFILMIIGWVGVMMTPTDMSFIPALIVACIAIYMSMYILQGLHYTLLEEGNFDVAISGTAVGIIATLGYLPEAICPIVAGRFLDIFPGIQGYQYYFSILVGLAVIGLICTVIWLRITVEKRKEIAAINKSKKATQA